MHQEIIPWKREQNKNRLLDNVNENLYLCRGLQTDANNMSKIKEIWLWVKQHKYAVTIIGFVLLVCVIDPHNMIKRMEHRRQIRELKKEIEHYTDILNQSERGLQVLANDSNNLERIARERYGMHLPDEDVYIIKE